MSISKVTILRIGTLCHRNHVLSGESRRANIDSKDILIYYGCFCVLRVSYLIQLILHKGHRSKYSIQLSTSKMYRDLR